MTSPVRHVTGSAPVNIAVIKYWGKRDETLLLPINSSLSGTLNQDDLKTTTSVLVSRDLPADRLWLNGKEEETSAKRFQNVIKAIRARAQSVLAEDGTVIIDAADWPSYHVSIVSKNNFPTAAGLASSASGYACLVFTLAKAFNVSGDITTIARVGSGSACRSLAGGWVRWNKGSLADGTDSGAIQIADEKHWPEMQVLIAVVSDHKKDVSSTSGMQTSVKTSPLIAHRAEAVVPKRLAEIEDAIQRRDFEAFGRITIQDSNQFHAVCLDTYPPIFYMNDVSRRIIQLCSHINQAAGRIVAAYTFDAGPNAVIYALKDDVPSLLDALTAHFPPPSGTSLPDYLSKSPVAAAVDPSRANVVFDPLPAPSLKYILHTSVGDGPRVLPASESLLDPATGLPIA